MDARQVFAILGLSLGSVVLGGCGVSTASGSVEGGILIASGGYLGMPAQIQLHRTREVPGPCKTRGDTGLWVDCTTLENVPGRFVSATCAPSTACEITMKGAEDATFLPLEDSFTVRVEAEFEGKTETVEQRFSAAMPPGGALSIRQRPRLSATDETPEVYFEGGNIVACRIRTDSPYELSFEQEGVLLPTKEERLSPSCLFARLGRGKVKVSSILTRPRRVYEAQEFDVLPISRVTDITGSLRYEESGPGQTPAFLFVGSVYGVTKEGSIGFLGTPALRLEGGGVTLVPLPDSRTGYSSYEDLFHVSAKPDATFRVYVEGEKRFDVKLEGIP